MSTLTESEIFAHKSYLTFIRCSFLYIAPHFSVCLTHFYIRLHGINPRRATSSNYSFIPQVECAGKTLYVHIYTLTFKVAYWKPESCKIWEVRWTNLAQIARTTYFLIIFQEILINRVWLNGFCALHNDRNKLNLS